LLSQATSKATAQSSATATATETESTADTTSAIFTNGNQCDFDRHRHIGMLRNYMSSISAQIAQDHIVSDKDPTNLVASFISGWHQ
jgi:hypothetical protein